MRQANETGCTVHNIRYYKAYSEGNVTTVIHM